MRDALYVLAWFYAMPALAAITLVAAASRWPLGRTGRSRLMLLALFVLASWVSVLARPDVWHGATTVPSFLICMLVAAEQVLKLPWPNGRRATLLMPSALAVAGLSMLGRGSPPGTYWLHQDRLLPNVSPAHGQRLVPCRLDRCGPIRIQPEQQQHLRRVVRAVHRLARPGEPILDLTDQGLYYLSRRPSATRFYLRSFWGASPRLQRAALEEIRRGGGHAASSSSESSTMLLIWSTNGSPAITRSTKTRATSSSSGPTRGRANERCCP